MAGETEISPEEKRARHMALYRQMGKIALWSGWAVAFLAMWLSGKIIDRLKARVAELQAENQKLSAQISSSPVSTPGQRASNNSSSD